MTYPDIKKLRMLQMNLKLFGFTQKKLAAEIGRDASMVSMVFSRKRISRPTLNAILSALKRINGSI